MRDEYNVPGTPLADFQYIMPQCLGCFHGEERCDYESKKVYRWNKYRQMWVYHRPLKMLGPSTILGLVDEIAYFKADSGSEAPGEASDS